MLVELLYVEGCPHHLGALSALRASLARRGRPDQVSTVLIADEAQALVTRFLGSPTIRINGLDVDPGATTRTAFGLQCRVYAGPEGLQGTPPEEWLTAAIAAASDDGSR